MATSLGSLARSPPPSLTIPPFQDDYSTETSPLSLWSNNSLFQVTSLADLVQLADEFFLPESEVQTTIPASLLTPSIPSFASVSATLSSTSSTSSTPSSSTSSASAPGACSSPMTSFSSLKHQSSCTTTTFQKNASSSTFCSASSSSSFSSTSTPVALTPCLNPSPTSASLSSLSSASNFSTSHSSHLFDDIDFCSSSWWQTTKSLTDACASPYSNQQSYINSSPYLSCSSYSNPTTLNEPSCFEDSTGLNWSELDFDSSIRSRKVSLSAIWCDSSCIKHGRKRKFSHVSSVNVSSHSTPAYASHAWHDSKLPLLSSASVPISSTSSSSPTLATTVPPSPNLLTSEAINEQSKGKKSSPLSLFSSNLFGTPSVAASTPPTAPSTPSNTFASNAFTPNSTIFSPSVFKEPASALATLHELRESLKHGECNTSLALSSVPFSTKNNACSTSAPNSPYSKKPLSISTANSIDSSVPSFPKESLLLSSEITKNALLNSFAVKVHHEEDTPPLTFSPYHHPALAQFPLIPPSQPLPKGSPPVFLTLVESTPVYLCVIQKNQAEGEPTVSDVKQPTVSSKRRTISQPNSTSTHSSKKRNVSSSPPTPPLHFLLRRADTHYVNATSLLVAGGVDSEHERSIVLSLERARMKIPSKPTTSKTSGPAHLRYENSVSLAGTWIPLERARALANTCSVETQLSLFLCDFLPGLFPIYSSSSFLQEQTKPEMKANSTIKLPPVAFMRPSYPGFKPTKRPSLSIVTPPSKRQKPTFYAAKRRSSAPPTTPTPSAPSKAFPSTPLHLSSALSTSPISGLISSESSTCSPSSSSPSTPSSSFFSDSDNETEDIDPMATESEDEETCLSFQVLDSQTSRYQDHLLPFDSELAIESADKTVEVGSKPFPSKSKKCNPLITPPTFKRLTPLLSPNASKKKKQPNTSVTATASYAFTNSSTKVQAPQGSKAKAPRKKSFTSKKALSMDVIEENIVVDILGDDETEVEDFV